MRSFASFQTLLLASALVASLPGVAPCQSPELAGVSAAVRGTIELARAAQPVRTIASGERIHLRDSLESGPDSGLQVLLLDETVFTLGPDSAIVIDEFVYDPDSGHGNLDAEILRGVFRFVSGRIAKEQADDVRLRTPSGTIGIRGTIVAGRVKDDGSALVVLLGPGRNANSQDRPGAVRVEAGGRHVDLVRANWATRLPGDGLPPTDPFPLALSDLADLARALASGASPPPRVKEARAPRAGEGPQREGEQPAPGPNATELSGQATAMGSVFGRQALSEVGMLAAVQKLDSVAGQMPFQDAKVATILQLEAITSGVAVYDRPGVSFANGGGFDFGFVIDFGQQQASFGMQNITSPLLLMPPGNGVTLNAVTADFASGNNGLAIFAIPTSFGFGPVCNPCNVLVNADVLNVAGQVAAGVAAKVQVQGSGVSAQADLGKIPGFFVP